VNLTHIDFDINGTKPQSGEQEKKNVYFLIRNKHKNIPLRHKDNESIIFNRKLWEIVTFK